MNKELTTKQKAIMEIAGMSEIDITHAQDWYKDSTGKEASWEQAFDLMSSMRVLFARCFYEELAKLKVTA